MTPHRPNRTRGSSEPQGLLNRDTRAEGSLRHSRVAEAVVGLLTAGVAVGAGQLTAALAAPRAAPVVAVGAAIVDLVPTPVKTFVVRTLGTYDKPALVAGILTILAVLAVVAGTLALRRLAAGLVLVLGLGVVGGAAALAGPVPGLFAAVPSLVASLAAGASMVVLVRTWRAGTAATRSAGDADGTGSPAAPIVEEDSAPTSAVGRRPFLTAGVATGTIAAVSGIGGRALVSRRSGAVASRTAMTLPTPADPAPKLPQGYRLRVPGAPPFFTPNNTFYRIDTALVVPHVDPQEWTLRIHGMVDREIELTFDDLLSRPLLERDITIACVSNQLGGSLAGTARWLGVSLADLLREAGVRRGATQVVSRAVGGMNIGTPTESVMDGRNSLLTVAMNGRPLPFEHGFPARMVVPGLYGYVSATKWVVDLELTTFAAYDAYWVRRGWAERAPITTMSRIDTPSSLAEVPAGRVNVAGVAWAQHRGIDAVEVRVDGGPWREARLSTEVNIDTWRQWVWSWDATPGRHRLQVRATDGRGVTQQRERTPPFPDGATGWHSVVVNVE